MAGRKIEFQFTVADDKQWEEELKRKGLLGVDHSYVVYDRSLYSD